MSEETGPEGQNETPVEPATEEKVIPALDVPFSAMLNKTTGTINFVHVDGRSYSILSTHRGYDKAKELLTAIDDSEPGSEDEARLRDELFQLTVPASRIAKHSQGDIKIENGQVFYKDRPVHNVVADRILWLLDHDEDIRVMVRFLDRLMANPSYRAVRETYRFLEKNQMAITRDGKILAYKKIRGDYTDIYSGKFDNTPGQEVLMPRNEVDENKDRTCSEGLHLCGVSYLPSFGTSNRDTDRVVICECDPADVVSIPTDYNDAKMRVCKYRVLRELTKDEGDVLGAKPVWEPQVAA